MNKIKYLSLVLLLMIFSVSFSLFVSASGFSYSTLSSPSSYNTYYSSSDIGSYWPILGNKEQCESRQDVLLQIAPAGCSPSVVRSDLLAEQNVPVFCQIQALQINPLINIKSIRSMSFTGKYPDAVAGVAFHPAKEALNTRDNLLGNPVVNDVGYVVVLLKKNANESSLPSSVLANLSAKISYDSGNAFGIGRYDFLLREQSDLEWEQNKNLQTFMHGQFSVRLEQVEQDYAIVSIYSGSNKIQTVNIPRNGIGSSSNVKVYLPGFYCQAALNLEYTEFQAAATSARIEVSDNIGTDSYDVFEGSTFMDGKCSIRRLSANSDGQTGKVEVRCNNNKPLVLEIKQIGFTLQENVQYIEGVGSKSVRKDATLVEIFPNNVYSIQFKDGEVKNVSGNNLLHVKNDSSSSFGLSRDSSVPSDLENAYNEAIAAYERVADEYPNEKDIAAKDNDPSFGQQSLQRAIDLSFLTGRNAMALKLFNELKEKYPGSTSAINDYQYKIDLLSRYDSTLSANTLFINNQYVNIRLVQINTPTKQPSVSLTLNKLNNNGASEKVIPNINLNYLEPKSINDDVIKSIKLLGVNSNYINLGVNCTINNQDKYEPVKVYLRRSFSLFGTGTTYNSGIAGDSDTYKVCGQSLSISIDNLDAERAARIRMIPSVQNTGTETNLSVRIGIEKRAIQLNPEKTNETIQALNESVQKWEKIGDNLGKAVTGLKAACLATSTLIVAKNLFTGLDGTALARQKAMDGYWKQYCADEVAKKDSQSKNMDECYAKNADGIAKSIELYKNEIKNTNDNLQKYAASHQQDTQFGAKKANSVLVGMDYVKNDLKPALSGVTMGDIKVLDENGNTIDVDKFIEGLNEQDLNNSAIYQSQAMDMALQAKIIKSSASDGEKNAARKKLAEQIVAVQKMKNYNSVIAKSGENAAKVGLVAFVASDDKARIGEWTSGTVANLPNDVPIPANIKALGANTKIQYISFKGKDYYVTLDDTITTKNGEYKVRDVYELSGEINQTIKDQLVSKYPTFQKIDGSSYINPSEIKVKYFETGSYKGVPYVVPIDKREGWYAGVQADVGLFNEKKSVDASGAVQSFWLCNVGSNHIEDFDKSGHGDDKCKRIDLYTGQVIGEFNGMAKAKVENLAKKAVEAIKDAQRGYKDGVKVVNILGEATEVGNPVAAINGANCAEFMSTSDCNIIFNLCDPVVCPNSRCNLGGTFTVPDVIQSGIVGSAVLCLPNFGNPTEGGVVIPVCLSGLKAGVDGYVSVLKAHKDCLQENLNSGKMIGICDQIYSVYMCDFFWRQVAPVVNQLLPNILEYATGQKQKVSGGGEYTSVMFAWQNAKKSVDYFTQTYALNSFKAFQSRNVEQIGSEFCKSFISTASPNSIKSLISADSPPQFYASFDSQTFSSATVPATAQYKVFYHIFAGKDSGVYYNVYLKNPPEMAYLQATNTIQVSSGFIAKGQSADETKDFTAPEGYKQLCVRINDQEECGFKQVTTSFAVDYLKDKIVSDQITQTGVKTAQECVSGAGAANGDFNAAALINTNIQSAAQEATTPKIYERGIVRVCATDNPAGSTNPSRYTPVGYCGDSKTICWLDQKSVSNAIEKGDSGIRNQTLSELQKINSDYYKKNGGLDSMIAALAQFKKVKEDISNLTNRTKKVDSPANLPIAEITAMDNKIEGMISNIQSDYASDINQNVTLLNSYKAELLFLKGQLKEVVTMVYTKYNAKNNVQKGVKSSGSPNEPKLNDANNNKLVYKITSKDKTIYFSYSTINNVWVWSTICLGPYNSLLNLETTVAYPEYAELVNKLSNMDYSVGNSYITELMNEANPLLNIQSADCIPLKDAVTPSPTVNDGLELKTRPDYDSKYRFIFDNTNNKFTDVYIQGNHVYLLKTSGFGIDWSVPDTLIGNYKNKEIILNSDASKEIGEDLFGILDYAIVQDNKLILAANQPAQEDNINIDYLSYYVSETGNYRFLIEKDTKKKTLYYINSNNQLKILETTSGNGQGIDWSVPDTLIGNVVNNNIILNNKAADALNDIDYKKLSGATIVGIRVYSLNKQK